MEIFGSSENFSFLDILEVEIFGRGNFRKFQKFPDTNILWKFSEVPKTSRSYILTKWKFLEVLIISFVHFCMRKVPKYVDYYFFVGIDEVSILLRGLIGLYCSSVIYFTNL